MEKRFFGNPCRACSSTERYESTGRCVPCRLRAGAKWAKLNAEKVRSNKVAWATANPDKMRKASAAWGRRNPSLVRARNLAYRFENRDRLIALKASWDKENPERARVYCNNRRANKFAAFKDGTATPQFFKQLYHSTACGYCQERFSDGEEVHADHRIPLRAYGAPHASWNIVPSCERCNISKRDKLDVETVLEVASTPGGRAWVRGPGREWLHFVLPQIWDGPKWARDAFPGGQTLGVA